MGHVSFNTHFAQLSRACESHSGIVFPILLRTRMRAGLVVMPRWTDESKAIPIALEGGHLMASAPTGSGKTLAFLLPIVTLLGKQGKKAQKKGLGVNCAAFSSALLRVIDWQSGHFFSLLIHYRFLLHNGDSLF